MNIKAAIRVVFRCPQRDQFLQAESNRQIAVLFIPKPSSRRWEFLGCCLALKVQKSEKMTALAVAN